jgi:hypothetical protein
LIRGDSIPDFYEWTVTSAVDKALEDKQVTFRMTGYTLTSSNFNGGVQFWSKDVATHLGNYYAGPTDVLIVTRDTTPSLLFNTLVAVASIFAIVAALIEMSLKRQEARR